MRPAIYRASLSFVLVVLATLALPLVAGADPLPAGPGRTFIVDCSLGGKIMPKITAARTNITIKGTCVENVVIQFDDIVITTDGVVPATIVPANPGLPTILLEGAQRVLINGRFANGITVNGGFYGIAATRNSELDVRFSTVTGTTQNGVLASYSSSVVVENCAINGNAGNGGVAANNSSLVITNSTVSSNTGNGLTAVRNSFLRMGQDVSGTTVLKPVTVSANGSNGVVVADTSSGIIVGGTVQTSGSGRSNIFVGRASSAQIGLGANGLTGGVTVQSGTGDGISVEGGTATIVFSTITGNALRGIIVQNAGGARIGVLNDSSAYGPNTITNNGTNGILVVRSSGVVIGGSTISGNGTAATGFRVGINVDHASATLVGNNTIQNNAETGVFVSGGQVVIGEPGFGLPTGNVITGNGATGPNTGGVFAFEGAVVRINDASISGNVGPAIQAFEHGTIEVRGATTVSGTPGAQAQFGSTLRLRDTASITNASGDAIQASNLTAIQIRDATTTVSGGGGGFGVNCFTPGSTGGVAGAPTVTLTGNFPAGMTHTGCNIFP